MFDQVNRIEIDLSCANTEAVRNSHLLLWYSQVSAILTIFQELLYDCEVLLSGPRNWFDYLNLTINFLKVYWCLEDKHYINVWQIFYQYFLKFFMNQSTFEISLQFSNWL